MMNVPQKVAFPDVYKILTADIQFISNKLETMLYNQYIGITMEGCSEIR